MIFAKTIRFNRHALTALPLAALLALAGCSSNDGTTTSSGGSGGSSGGAGGSTGGSGGSGGSGTGGAAGATGGAGGATGGAAGATGGSGGSTGGSAGAAGADAGTGLHGSFIITLKNEPEPAFTNFVGRIYNGPQPPSQLLTLDSKEGACELLVPKAPFCRPPCMGGVCIDENTCMPSPALVHVGTAAVTGLNVGPLMLMPDAQTKIYQVTPTLGPNACSEGGAMSINTDKFMLATKCVAPLKLAAGPMDKIPVKTGSPVRLVWDPPGQTGISRVYIHLDIAHHGGKKGEINCDVPDNGSFDIPTALTAKLISLGLAGFPTINVKRYSMATSTQEPNVKIQIDTDLEREVDTGVNSCNEDTDCTPPQKCQTDKTCK
jgi:hypothetical protein